MTDNNSLFNLLREIAQKCEESPEQAMAIESNYLQKVHEQLMSKGRLVDQRRTDAKSGIFSGFAAIHYAAYFNLHQCFPFIFDKENDITTGQEIDVNTKVALIPLGQNSSPLQIAILRKSSQVISFYDQKITGDPKFRSMFLPFQNRSGATHLHLAVLNCDCSAVMELFENKFLIEQELPVGASTEGIFGVICTFGQQKPLTMLMKHEELHSLIYKVVLQYTKKPNYLELCERDIDYALFNTSKTQKNQLKKQMAILIQDALDYCLNQHDLEWKVLLTEWKKNPIYHYDENDTMKQNGKRIGVREQTGQVQEGLKVYTLGNWFEGQEVEQNKIEYVGCFDERPTDPTRNIYKGFPLSFYCILNNQLEVLKQILYDEQNIVLAQSVTLELKAGKIILARGASLMHAAIQLNQLSFVIELLKLSKMWTEQTASGETCYTLAIKLKNQASITLLKSTQYLKQLEQEQFSEVILKCAFQNENLFVLENILQTLSKCDDNTRVSILKSCLVLKDEFKSEAKRIFQFLQKKAQKYVEENDLIEDWAEELKDFYGQDQYDQKQEEQEKIKELTLDKLQEKTELKFSLAIEPQVADEIFDQNSQKQQIYYENEVQAFENQLFRDQNPFESRFFDGDNLQQQITLMNLVLDDSKECVTSVQDIVKDDIVAKIPKRLQDWLESCQRNVTSMAQAMHRSHLHAVDLRPSQLQLDANDCIYNGFAGIHYGIVSGHWDIVQLLLDYELCDVTKARVLVRAPGIGNNKLVIVPIGTNCLQLAAICNQTQILALLVDELVKRNTARLIDPIQMSFGKKPPLTLNDKLQLFIMKNELDQNILATLSCCRAFWDEESVAALCLEFQTKDLTGKTPSQCDFIVQHRMDLVFKYAALFTNARLIRLVRSEFLTNPLERFSDENYAQVCFQVAQALVELHDAEYSELYRPQDYKDTEREVDNTLVFIAAKYYLKQQENNQIWENLFQQLEQNETFIKCKEAAIKNVDILKRPAYHSEIPGQFIRVQREIVTPHYYYLDNVVQPPQISCYFDAIINGDMEFVKLCYKEFIGKIEKRQTRGSIVNGFTALLYACYYKHIAIIKLLLQLEYDATINAEPQQILVTNAQSDYSFIFKHRVNYMQIAIMSGDQDLVDNLLKLTREQKLLRNVVFPEKQKTDIMKLAIYNKCGCIFKYGDLIKKELMAESELLKTNNQLESILYSICKEQDPYSVVQVKTLLVQLNDRQIIEAFYYSCLQRLENEDGMRMTALDWLYSTVMIQLNKPKLIPVYQQAIKFVNQLTNSALIFAFNNYDQFSQNMLEMYYGSPELLEKLKQYFDNHKTEFNPDEWCFNKESSIKNNFLVQLHQIASQDFDQYSNEEELCKWFTICCYGTGEEVKKMIKCAKARDLRMNNYQEQIYTEFTGLMYAIMMDNVQAFEVLLNLEADMILEKEQVLYFNDKYFYAAPKFSTLHLAAICGNQQFFDMLLKIYQAKNIVNECIQSPSALALMSNKQISDYQLLKDFKSDKQLFRLAVQYGRVTILKKLLQFGTQKELKSLFYENVFSKAETEGVRCSVLDLIASLEENIERQIDLKQVLQVKNLVKQTIANCLTEIVVNNQLQEYQNILDQFYDDQHTDEKIRKEYELYMNPIIINDVETVRDNFCKVSNDQIIKQNFTFTFHEHTSIEIQWFSACCVNDIAFVKENLKSFSSLTDKRPTQIENKINRGLTGLMYAIIYNSFDVAQLLLDIDYDQLLMNDTVVKIEQQMFYLPKNSSILHMALCTQNDLIINKILQKVRPASPIWAESNSLQFTPVVFMSGLCQNYEVLFNQFISRLQKFEMLLILNNCLKVNNFGLIKRFLQSKDLKMKEIFYEFVFDVSQRKQINNETEKLILKQQEVAIIYALENSTNKRFEVCLKNMFGQEIEKVRQEFFEQKNYREKGLVQCDIETIVQQFNVVKQDQMIPPPELVCLPKSKLNEEQLKWFQACKIGEASYVRSQLEKHQSLVDDRSSLVDENYAGFNGLFYSVINGQFEIFSILLSYEQNYKLKKEIVIRLPGQDRYYLLEQGSTVVNLIAVCGQQKFFTSIIQNKDRFLFEQLFHQLTQNKTIIQSQIGNIFFSEEVFVSYLNQEQTENLIYQLFVLKDENYIKKIITFVDVCGVHDKLTQQVFELTLTAIDELKRNKKENQYLSEDPYFKPLMDRAIRYSITQHKQLKWKNLLRKNLKEVEIKQKIQQYVNDLQHCDCVKEQEYNAILDNCYCLRDTHQQIPEQQIQRDETFQDEYLDEWFSACREGALDFIERSVSDCKCQTEKRKQNTEFEIFQGWSGIHYAAFYGQVDVVKFLFNYEYKQLTVFDTILTTPGVGFGIEFLCSKQTNCLQLALLTDQLEVVRFLLQKCESELPISQFFMGYNIRQQSALFTAALCWRSRSGQLFLNSKQTLNEIGSKKKTEAMNVIQIIRYLNCAYLGSLLQVYIASDNQLKSLVYQTVLECDVYHLTQYGSQMEIVYCIKYFDLILRDALNYCLKQKETIQWSGICDQFCKKWNVYVQALIIQFARTDSTCVENGEVIIDDEFVELAQKKLKPVVSAGGSGLSNLPGRKQEMRKKIENDWSVLGEIMKEVEAGK